MEVIGPAGRALDQKMGQMSPDQFNQYVMGQMQAGAVKSFPEIMALKMQYDKIKQSATPAQPPQGTVVGDMEQQIAGAQLPENTGIAALPAPAMDDAQYANGGIVALAGGSPPSSPPGGPPGGVNMSGAGLPPPQMPPQVAAAANAANAGTATPAQQSLLRRWLNSVQPSRLNPNIGTPSGGGLWNATKGVGRFARSSVGPGIALGLGSTAVNTAGTDTQEIADYYKAMGEKMPDAGESVLGDLRLRTAYAVSDALPFGEDPKEWIQEQRRLKAQREQEAATPKPAALDPTLAGYFDKEGSGAGAGGLGSLAGSDAMRAIAAKLEGRIPKGKFDRAAAIKDAQKESEGMGIGKADKRQEELRQQDIAELESQKKSDPWMSAAEGFFKMAEGASESGATFLGSAAKGATAGLGSFKEAKAAQKSAKKEIDKSEIELMKADELRKAGFIAKADTLEEKAIARQERAEDKATDAQMKLAEMDARRRETEYTAQAQLLAAQIRQSGDGDTAEQFRRAYLNALKQGKVADAKRILDSYTEMFQPTVVAAREAAAPTNALISGIRANMGGGGSNPGGFRTQSGTQYTIE
jgi:hypothetical protein